MASPPPRHIAIPKVINALCDSIERWREEHPDGTVGAFIKHLTTKCFDLMEELHRLFPEKDSQEQSLYARAIELACVPTYIDEYGWWFGSK